VRPRRLTWESAALLQEQETAGSGPALM